MPNGYDAAIPVIVIAGATGTGKSALAAIVANRVGGDVVNADSRQVYADFPIITAQPGPAEAALAPHRLYGFLPCQETLGAGAYAELAAREIREIHGRGRVPVLVGGTGLYLQTLLSGIAPIPAVDAAVSRHWREECLKKGAPALHALLTSRDPEYAARLHPNDSQRITRALEVLEGTGKSIRHWHAQPVPPSPFRPLSFHIDVPLATIAPRLEARIDAMIEAGAVAEAKAAYTVCTDPEAPGWSGIGCAELFAYITGKTDYETCRAAWVHNTRSYAKRQITWFKRDKHAQRITPDDAAKVVAAWNAFRG